MPSPKEQLLALWERVRKNWLVATVLAVLTTIRPLARAIGDGSDFLMLGNWIARVLEFITTSPVLIVLVAAGLIYIFSDSLSRLVLSMPSKVRARRWLVKTGYWGSSLVIGGAASYVFVIVPDEDRKSARAARDAIVELVVEGKLLAHRPKPCSQAEAGDWFSRASMVLVKTVGPVRLSEFSTAAVVTGPPSIFDDLEAPGPNGMGSTIYPARWIEDDLVAYYTKLEQIANLIQPGDVPRWWRPKPWKLDP